MASALPYEPQTWNRYAYVLNNPIKLIDPTGMMSTHTDSEGTVIAVYNDGDLGVYVHEQKWDKKSNLSNKGPGVKKIGETHFWDDFRGHDKAGNITDTIAEGARIVIDRSLDFNKIIENKNQEARKMGLNEVKNKSKNGEPLDIKSNNDIAKYGPNTGGLLNGKFVTARSAGNFLAGMNAATVTDPLGIYVSFDAYMRIAGEYEQTQKVGFWGSVGLRTGITNPTVNVAPYYGESRFSGIYIENGYNYGVTRR